MVVSDQKESQRIREDWRSVFDRLPPDSDQEQLAQELKPKWRQLPKRFNVTPADGGVSQQQNRILGGSSCMENPPINPITGFGRTSTEVQRETRAYRAAIRRQHLAVEFPAVFQGDYLFIQLPSKPIFLARVVHDCCIDDAISPSITFTIGEYVHTPQEGVPGFFGTFTKKENSAYDPNDRRMGGKFVRLQNITRHEVVLYDVATWTDREMIRDRAAQELPPEDCVRVKPSSLRALATKLPELALPLQVPESHLQMDRAEQVAQRAQEQRDRHGDDPPPQIPDGFELVEWSEGQAIKHFLLWTSLDRGEVQWHQGKVVKALAHHRAGYTHDANFVDKPGVRGIRLTHDTYEEGCWVAMKEREVSAAATNKRALNRPRVSTRLQSAR